MKEEGKLLQHIKQVYRELKARDPLKHIPDDYVCIVHPRMVNDIENGVPATLPVLDKLSAGCGRRAFIVNDAVVEVEYMSVADAQRRYGLFSDSDEN